MDQILEQISKFTHDQYSNENRLNARMQIYRYGENETKFYHWIYDNMDFTNVKYVLEIGCGNGALWRENISKISEDVSFTLTDISEGMIDSARKALEEKADRF